MTILVLKIRLIIQNLYTFFPNNIGMKNNTESIWAEKLEMCLWKLIVYANINSM